MQKRISKTLLLTVAVAIVTLFAASEVMAGDCPNNSPDYTSWQCNGDGLKFISMEVQPCSSVGCDPSGFSTLYTFDVINETDPEASHVNLLLDPGFSEKIVSCVTTTVGVTCEPVWLAKPDPSTGGPHEAWGKYISYYRTLKLNLIGWNGDQDLTVKLEIPGQHDKNVGETMIKGGSDPSLWSWGAILLPSLFPTQKVIASTGGSFTYVDPDGNPHTIAFTKDEAGNILSMTMDGVPVQGTPWNQAQVSFDGGTTWESWKSWWPPEGLATKSGTDSTCAYWYRGVYWDFCP